MLNTQVGMIEDTQNRLGAERMQMFGASDEKWSATEHQHDGKGQAEKKHQYTAR